VDSTSNNPSTALVATNADREQVVAGAELVRGLREPDVAVLERIRIGPPVVIHWLARHADRRREDRSEGAGHDGPVGAGEPPSSANGARLEQAAAPLDIDGVVGQRPQVVGACGPAVPRAHGALLRAPAAKLERAVDDVATAGLPAERRDRCEHVIGEV
jgi:hypothetical protein